MMVNIIIVFGILTFISGMIIIINPEIVFGLLRDHYQSLTMHVLAIVVRLVLGALLIAYAGVSKYPLVIEFIGWLSIVAAIVFALIGRETFKRLISWALSLTKPLARVGGVVAAGFGLFLIYAFVE